MGRGRMGREGDRGGEGGGMGGRGKEGEGRELSRFGPTELWSPYSKRTNTVSLLMSLNEKKIVKYNSTGHSS
jgi:hypothetical protein